MTLGATAVLFEGVADHPEPDRIWRFIERHGITQYALSPTTARTLAAAGERWVAPYDLPTLRIILSSGEPWTLPAWRWLHRHVGRGRVPIINWSGGTEVGGCIVASYPDVATAAGRFSGAALGMAIDVVDDAGRSVTGELGELVVTRSWPAMTRGLWGETERYLDTYWSRLPGRWVQGDRALRFADGSIEIPGRSDDVLKIAGKRVGPAELESLATEVDGVTAAAAIGIDHPTKGQAALLVVQVSCPPADETSLTKGVADRIATGFGKPMRPAAVLAVPDLPRTRSGKVHRRAVRAWVTGSDPGDLSSLENPEAEADVRLAALGREDYDEFAHVRHPDGAVRRTDLHSRDGDILSALIWGDQKPALLLMHGGGQNAHTWDGVALALNRPLIALDLPGHGRSSHRPDRDYWPWRNAEVVADVLPQLTAPPLVVVGMSLGGLTGIRLAAQRPDLVRALVVVDVTPGVHEVDMTSQERGGSSLVTAEPTFASFADLVAATAAATGRRIEAVAVGARHNSFRRTRRALGMAVRPAPPARRPAARLQRAVGRPFGGALPADARPWRRFVSRAERPRRTGAPAPALGAARDCQRCRPQRAKREAGRARGPHRGVRVRREQSMTTCCEGLVVLELGSGSIAGALCGMLLADNGARVLKIEPPEGDRLRREMPSGFLVWCRGKESVVIDLRTDAGRHELRELARGADVVIDGFAPGVTARWGVDGDVLRAHNPRLVHCSITAFGRPGGYSSIKGYEAAVAAKAGLFTPGIYTGRPAGGDPMFVNAPLASVGAGHLACSGVLAALVARETTGRGEHVAATLLQGLTPTDYFGTMHWQVHLQQASEPDRPRVAPPARPPALLCSKDGRWINTSTTMPHQLRALVEALGSQRAAALHRRRRGH